MPPWWGKFSPKDAKKKESKESKIDTIHPKNKISSDEKRSNKSEGSCGRYRDNGLDRGSAHVSRCLSFEHMPFSRPLPLPGEHLRSVGCTDSKGNALETPGAGRGSKPLLFLPLPKPKCKQNRSYPTDAGDIATCSVSSRSSIDSDRSESCLLSPQIADCEYGKITAINSPTSVMYKVQSASFSQKNRKETLNQENIFINNQIPAASPKHGRHTHMPNLQIPHHNAFCSTPDIPISSPSRSPMGRVGTELVMNSGFGHCSSPGSGYNSGPNSVAGDVSGQRVWQHSRCSSECSPIASPRMTSPGPSSRIHSSTATPLHHRAGEAAMDSPTRWLGDGKQKSHPLPLPPITCPFSRVNSTATTSSVPRSPGKAENPISPSSRWKKGRLLGMGTFGHVYLGFNRESGEMCAMKEVTLLPYDVKSKESSQQLGQEIALLSRLRHPNIVQYYGSETVGDRLYIYLEFVSGGSIYKLLQDYGQLGEMALRSYTCQILSGLAYLHDKNTVHRDIKGANLLVDPSGRVKLADFGMAKHITGHSCPLSFKGSPYWMAPELIKNSSGCNLAVDIWSLGCTVLEMATGKPPWSQYEGVAALFKIGNSKELPAIPDHLSEEGKDFVNKCLQRNPILRPTAAQLFEHPFIKNTTPFERPIQPPALGSGGRVSIYKSRGSKMVSKSREERQ